ncbi:hypothetical protein ACHHYP_02979 [Achlya hypogyna]|uniref:Uncharacterized protein n=1 Tax=Achlya hypogyna TaxID=1202772 RepID=A0A1V9Z505_ACHHY|nr:hypothetical protein ACHHYP_02979 [Achlya hypogyna]
MLASSMISSIPAPANDSSRTKRKLSCDSSSGGMSPSSMDELPTKKSKVTEETHFDLCPRADPVTRECPDAPLQEATLRDHPSSSVTVEDGECTDVDNAPSPQDTTACDLRSPRSPASDWIDPYNDGAGYYDDYADDADRGRRTLKLEYWTRSDECKERKWDHLDQLDSEETGRSREEHIYATTLAGRTSYMEPNMFPYETPAGIEHWTLWSRHELRHVHVQEYVERWISTNAPHVTAWNYDDNPERSIDIFHVHVYLQVGAEGDVLQGRRVEDLLH